MRMPKKFNMLNFTHRYLGSYITIVFLLLFTVVQAQSLNKTSFFRTHWQIGASAGTSLFFGDIKQYQYAPVSNYNNEWRAGGSLFLGVQASPVFGIRGQFLIGQLAGTRREWSTYFTSNYFDLTLNTTINLRNIISKYKPDQIWNAYVLLGIGIINFNTEVKDLKTDAIIRKVGFGNGSGIGGSTVEGILSGGLGLDFRLNKNLHLNMETSNRVLNSDILDGRESGFKYDIYNYTSVGLSYNFGSHKQQKHSEKYSYFDSNKKKKQQDKDMIHQADYDYRADKPVEPPEVDILVIENQKPVEPDSKNDVVIEQIVETPVIIEKESVNDFKGIEYRVQILAKYGNRISIQKISSKYNLAASEIFEDMHNGFYIYTIGSFPTYEQARTRRNEIRTNNGIRDAFVVAFENGKRLNKLP